MSEAGLERFRSYLLLLARIHLGEAGGPLEPSDVVQQTLLEAHQKREQFRGSTDAELAAWLRRLLFCTAADAWRTLHRDKRDISRQQRLQDSSAQMEQWLAADQSSPSEQAVKNERMVRLAAALEALPAAQRDAVVLRYFQGLSAAEIGERLGRSVSAVAGLLKRGLHELSEFLHENDP